MYSFTKHSVDRIARAVRTVETQMGYTNGVQAHRRLDPPNLFPWGTYLYTDENGTLKVHINAGWRLVLTTGQPEEVAAKEYDALTEKGYVYMRWTVGGSWIDSEPQYANTLPDDTASIRTVLIAVVDYTTEDGYRVRQQRYIVEVWDCGCSSDCGTDCEADCEADCTCDITCDITCDNDCYCDGACEVDCSADCTCDGTCDGCDGYCDGEGCGTCDYCDGDVCGGTDGCGACDGTCDYCDTCDGDSCPICEPD